MIMAVMVMLRYDATVTMLIIIRIKTGPDDEDGSNEKLISKIKLSEEMT